MMAWHVGNIDELRMRKGKSEGPGEVTSINGALVFPFSRVKTNNKQCALFNCKHISMIRSPVMQFNHGARGLIPLPYSLSTN